MILERTAYDLKDCYKQQLSTILSNILVEDDVLCNSEVENGDNEYYTSLDFLKKVKESFRLKQTTYVDSNNSSTKKTTKQLSDETSLRFFNAISSFVVSNCYLEDSVPSQSGRMLYPKNGYMGWHNNARFGWRLYCTYCSEDALSYFRYEDDSGSLIDCKENQGWNFRFFYIRDNFSPFWHSIYTETERVSLGTYLGRDIDKIKNLMEIQQCH
tara:strand:+ start:3134 stop:3772 length:639 start_codon:yes stop_codon:yes gene_type:complete